MLDVQERFDDLSRQRSGLRWYALVDGHQYEQHTGHRLPLSSAVRSLFEGTPDAPLAHAGPWLIDLCARPQAAPGLAGMEQSRPAVSWLVSMHDVDALAERLTRRLAAKGPDGREMLLRFYDPRVLGELLETVNSSQKTEFFKGVVEWHFLRNGQRVWMGRHGA